MRRGFPSLFGHRRAVTPFQRDFADLFEAFDQNWPFAGQNGHQDSAMPAVDVRELEDHLEVTADLPGLAKEDIELQCAGDRLLLKAERKGERTEEKEKGYRVLERHFGSYQRLIPLPFVVKDDAAIEARYKDGVLTVHIPKPEGETEAHKPIPIRFEH
ncbi:Hsp20/alpha crystallin family protein [Ferrimonas gelatinilytica]|uniref:SHSP domain-containing protein n=1 Tax=Ferrimonas gelatinilytica TaxID=1255257 RepID=A0ABP9RW71_9GAMM